MAKELPYFKFDAAEWISGEITLEDLTTQGVFVNICAYYWFRSGKLTLTEIKRRVKCKQAVFDRLVEQKLIKVTDDWIEISFLKDQFDERGHISEKNSKNGSLGGAPKGNKNAQKNNPKQPKTTNIEEKRREEKREEQNRREEKKKQPVTVPFQGLVLEAWNDWMKYRTEKKKTLTPSTIKRQIQFLGGRGDPEIIAIINKSITMGWEGLFELKPQNNGTNGNTYNGRHTTGTVRRADAVIEEGKDFGNF
jgi:hypothetical protein